MRTNEFLTELSNEKLAKYKTAASADASKADSCLLYTSDAADE